MKKLEIEDLRRETRSADGVSYVWSLKPARTKEPVADGRRPILRLRADR